MRIIKILISPSRLLQILRSKFLLTPVVVNEIDWNKRAEQLGAYSVIDNSHPPEEFEYVTKKQKEIIYPHFIRELDGNEKSILDFGCGSGRFTGDLADLINGNAIGVDATKILISLCQNTEKVKFIHSDNIFEESNFTYDIIWICLVLGGFSNSKIDNLAELIYQSLNPNGLLFMIESTGNTHIEKQWRVRTREELILFFPEIKLRHIATYHDAEQEISILAGRKSTPSGRNV